MLSVCVKGDQDLGALLEGKIETRPQRGALASIERMLYQIDWITPCDAIGIICRSSSTTTTFLYL